MPKITATLTADAKRLHDMLDHMARDLEAYSFGELRTKIDEAARDAENVLDAIADVDAALDEIGTDEIMAEREAHADHVADLADAASY